MMELNKAILKHLAEQLQVDDSSPSYMVRVWRVGELESPPYSFVGQEGGVVSITISGSEETGCNTATITFEDTYGIRTPEFDINKISDEYTAGITRSTFEKLLWPENKIQVCLGYGDLVIPVITGCIDSFEVDSKASTISIEIRDNMRFLVDQTIDPMKFGQALSYPREDTYVKMSPAKSIVEIVGVSSYLNVRSGPGTSYEAIGKATNGQTFTYLGSQSGWHNILYNGKNAYVNASYCILKDTPAVIDASQTIDQDTTQWLASSVVQDLAVIATNIEVDGEEPILNRTICNVITDKSVLSDPEIQNYTLRNVRFPFSLSYFESAMKIVNQLGNVSFRCNRYGDIMLYKNLRPSLTDFPDWIVTDYIELNSLNYNLDITDLRNRVLIISKNGMTLFEHKGITRDLMKCVNRTFSIEVPWAETPEQKHAAAVSFFNQMLDAFRKVTIAIKGNPLIEVGQVIQLNDLVSTATAYYQVRSWSHNFAQEGFITNLELEHITRVLSEQVTMISDGIPMYQKKFRFTLPIMDKPRPIKIKLAEVIYKAMIRIKDPSNGKVLVQIDLDEKVNLQNTLQDTSTIQLVYLLKDGVSVRTSPDINSTTNIKRQENSQFKAKYISTEGNFYKCTDKDGLDIYLWKDYCVINTSTGGKSSSVTTTGSAGTFVSSITSKVDCPYVWGTQGEILTQSLVDNLISTFGSEHYDNYKAKLGQQCFDCSGLVVWALRSMNIIPKSADHSAAGLYEKLCFPINKEELRAGDLVFRSSSGNINHVGIYIGNNEVVHAKGKKYGVVRETLPNSFNLFGRLKSLSDGEYVSFEVPASSLNVNRVPIEYTVGTNYINAPAEAQTKAHDLNGNVLFYHNNCVLYSVTVESEGISNNVLCINWAPINETLTVLEFDYEVLIY
jgi:cell wall-associated NlpC family hydrolase